MTARTAHELVDAYLRGHRSPRDVLERALAAAASLDEHVPPLRAFLSLDHEGARAQADASTRRWRSGHPLGPLDGVPVALKDEYDVAGQPTTCGTAFLDSPAKHDALVVTRLRAAGAVLLGKTNMHELGMGPTGLNEHHGAARNPHDPARDTGGSSSGSAAAVAAGVVPIALGTDSGGSLRVPGALCGVVALKGTYGRVPTAGVAMAFPSIGHAGALGSSVADVAAAFSVIADAPAGFASLHAQLAKAAAEPVRPLRVGVCAAWFDEATEGVKAHALAAVEALRASGATTVNVECPNRDLAIPVAFAIFGSEGLESLHAHLENQRPFGRTVRLTLDLARGLTHEHVVAARRARAMIAADLERALEAADVLLLPTVGVTAAKYHTDALAYGAVDEALSRALTGFTLPASLAGLPAAQVPCGHDAAGMPNGLQIIARRGADVLALRVAAHVEQTSERRRPRICHDLLE